MPNFSDIDYRTKAKHQKTVASLLLGSGAIVFLGTTIDGLSSNFFEPKPNAGKYLAASIPLFIVSHKNREKLKGISTSLINERVPILMKLNHEEVYYSALSIKFNF